MDQLIEQEVNQILKNTDNQFKNKNILITGGAGFLGSWLSECLVKMNANVLCLDNFSSGLEENLAQIQLKTNFKFKKHDISEPFNPEPFNPDIIFHLASRASPFEFSKHPIQILKANTLGTWIVLGITKRYNATLVFASTSEIYGDPDDNHIPTSEKYYGYVNPIGPRSCYDEAKRAGEAFAMAYILEHNLDIRVVRIFNVYGPRMRPGNLYGRVVPNFITQALSGRPITVFGDGTQTRSFTYITDNIEGLLKISISNKCKGEVINLGNDQEIQIIKLAKIIQKLTNSSSKITRNDLPEDDPHRRCPDISKARLLLNWEPKVNLEDGLRVTINWYKSQLK